MKVFRLWVRFNRNKAKANENHTVTNTTFLVEAEKYWSMVYRPGGGGGMGSAR